MTTRSDFETSGHGPAGRETIAIVGMACRYPDADDPTQLWQMVLDQRQAFRELPQERLDLSDYFDADRTVPDKTYGSMAALVEGWTFDRAAFRIPGVTYRATDPAHWLALETASRALDDAGHPGGQGLDRDRVAVVFGNSLTGDVTRAATLRLRWPYVRRTLAAAATESGLAEQQVAALLARAEARYLEPFPPVGDETLAGSLSNTIAGRICNHFDFHGGGYTVDGACSSALLAVINACTSLRDGSADLVLAGGVDLSIDPFELIGFAKTGALAAGRMWVYDERSSGFIPGEGCGVVALMRAADARAAGARVYAEITGWGVSSDGNGGITRPERQGQLRALRRAYAQAGVDPAAVRLFEGHGTGTQVGDEVELSALAELRRDAAEPAAIGSIKANIGHAKAASGVAGLIKATLSVASGVLPPTTGCERPHAILRSPDAPLRVLSRPEPWPAGPRLAGVSSFGFGGINAHVTLAEATSTVARAVATPRHERYQPTPRTDVVVLAGDDLDELRAVLNRLAELGPRLSEAELHDLACQFALRKPDGKHRVALVADTPRRLADRAALAAARLAEPRSGMLTTGDGVFVGTAVAGRVALLLPGQGAPVRADLGALGRQLTGTRDRLRLDTGLGAATGTAVTQSVIYRATIAALRWLDQLGVTARAAVGHSLGEIAGLVWAGCLSAEDGDRLVRRRGQVMETLGRRGTTMASVAADAATAWGLCAGTQLVVSAYNGPRSHVLAGPTTDIHDAVQRATRQGISAVVLPVSHAFHSPAMTDCFSEFNACLRDVPFQPPTGRLISSVSGQTLAPDDDIVQLLSEQLTAPVRFWDPISELLPETDLFCEVGPGHTLSALISAGCETPVVSIDAGADDDRALAETTAALFAAGAVQDLDVAFAGRPARPIEIWRDRVFLANPCSSAPASTPASGDASTARQEKQVADPPAGDVRAVVLGLLGEASELDPGLIDLDARLLGDLHLTSLRVTQLVVTAAATTGHARPVAPLLLADATVAELIDAVTALPAADSSADTATVAGLASWIGCFVEGHQRRIARPAAQPANWRTHITPGQHLSADANEVFAGLAGDKSDGPVVDLVYVPDPTAPPAAATLLAAARSAISSGALVVVTHGCALSGFLLTLRQEHPNVGITLLRVPESVDGLRVAARHADAEPGAWRELVLEAEGVISDVVPQPLSLPADGPLPLNRDDVLLVTGGGKGIAYECAAAAARACGVSLALLGRSDPDTDDVLRANLDRLREAGLRFAYESADVTDPLAVTRGIGRLAERVGPVTAVLHGSGINQPMRFADLDEAGIEAHLAPKVLGLKNLLASLDQSRLRLLVTFGSIIGRYGLAGESHYALANGALRAEAERLAEDLPSCRVLNIDWSVWAGAGMGEQLGVVDSLLRLDVTPIPTAEGVDFFLSLLRSAGLPTTVAVHGRIGGLMPTGSTPMAGRFLDRVLVHYAGVELVAECDLDISRDAYLNDHRIDGLPVLPAVAGMEAMAEAATALAGRPLLRMVDVTLDRPVVVDENAQRTIRVCALRQGDTIQVAVRSDETGYCVDHFRASFPLAHPAQPLDRPNRPEEEISLGPDDLYGPLYFHTGGFRLVERFSALGARHCHVHLRAPDGDQLHPVVSDAPLLGELTSNDATVHALQACVPHRRVLPVGCERFSRVAGTSAVREIFATERHAADGEYVWDVLGLDRFGKRAVRWVGLRLRDVGLLAVDRVWQSSLLAVYLERSALALGLHRDLRVTVGKGDRHNRNAAAPTGDDLPLAGTLDQTCRSYQNGMVLEVSAPCRTACDWEPVERRSDEEWRLLLGPGFDPLLAQLRTMLAEPVSKVAARIWTAVECLSKTDYAPNTPIVFCGVYDGGWAMLRAGSAMIASTVVSVVGVDVPVAIAVLTTECGPS